MADGGYKILGFMDAGMPNGWGPGPWDDDPSTWAEKAVQSGDIRPWRDGDPLGGGRPVTYPLTYRALGEGASPGGRVQRMRRPDELLVTCWCGRTNTYVPVHWVREGRTRLCRAPECWARWQLEKLRLERRRVA